MALVPLIMDCRFSLKHKNKNKNKDIYIYISDYSYIYIYSFIYYIVIDILVLGYVQGLRARSAIAESTLSK